MPPLSQTLRHPHTDDLFCPICHAPVSLETCKIDEDGQAMHEQCYVGKICSRNPTAPQEMKKSA